MKPTAATRSGRSTAGRDTPERIALAEWSGPVSPRYQYKTHIEVTRRGAREATLSYEHQGVYAGGQPTELLTATCPVPAPAYEALWAALDAAGVSTLEDAALTTELRTRVGVSVNTLEVARAGHAVRLEYTLAALKKPEGATRRAVIEALKSWASPLAIAATAARTPTASPNPTAKRSSPAKPARAAPRKRPPST